MAARGSILPGTRQWRVRHGLALGLAIGIGAALGIGGFTFRYAAGLSYFSPDPVACVNCHIMRTQYDGWQKASHHTVAVCIDCHLPHDFVPKYLAKAENGYRHSERFTTGAFVEPIRVQPRGVAILEANCRRCHAALAAEISHADAPPERELSCLHCHFSVGHGESARLGAPLSKHP
ncbi:MAG TPA: cytochrome c nitrite reductase small subunit [Polyangiaceae bacterium]|nr:cytochrome c nitrite reductase small subunit [Polyangiaceae bacterium]